MRIAECLALEINQIPWESKELKIINVKTKREEKIYFTDRCLYWLQQYLDRRDDDCLFVFAAFHGYAAMKKAMARN